MSNGIVIKQRVPAYTEGLQALGGLAASVISDVTGRVSGALGLRPVNRSPVHVCGNALTVQVRAGDNLLVWKATDMLQPGDVLVVNGEGDVSRALVGEIMMKYARSKGALAFVMDAAVRDVDAFETERFPCWARGVNLRGPYKDGPGQVNVPVSIGGMVVHPGDIIVGDSDGLLAIAPADALDIARKAHAKAAAEQTMMDEIARGVHSTAWVDLALKQKGA